MKLLVIVTILAYFYISVVHSSSSKSSVPLPTFEEIIVENDQEERPVPCTGHSMLTRGNALWLFGGIINWENGNKVQYGHVLWTYEPEDNTWDRTFASKGPAKTYKINETVQMELQGNWVNGVVTNTKPSESLVKVKVEFNNETLSEHWVPYSKLRYFPPATNMHIAAMGTTTSGSPVMYIQGGKGPQGKANSDTWIYFFNDDSWSRLILSSTAVEPAPREMHGGVLVDKGLYIFGGVKGSTVFGDQFFLNIKEAIWKRIENPFGSDIPKDRWGHRMVLTAQETDGHPTIWMFAGHSSKAAHNELWSLDWETKTWTFHGVNGTCYTHGAQTLREQRVSDSLAKPPAVSPVSPVSTSTSASATATATATATSQANKDSNESIEKKDSENAAGTETPEYSSAFTRPSRTTPWPIARKGHSMLLYKGHLVVFGGHGTVTDFMQDLWLYRISDGNWLGPIPMKKSMPERNYHAASIIGSYMYIFGGNNSRGLLNDFWKINLDTVINYTKAHFPPTETK